jgi:hypothetical protein
MNLGITEMMSGHFKIAGWCFATLTLLGCGGERLVPVSGIVTLDGQPVEQASVLFQHESGRTAFGLTDQTGVFQLSMDDEWAGVPVGSYAIAVSLTRETGGIQPTAEGLEDLSKPSSGPGHTEWIIPKRYHDPASSGLSTLVGNRGAHVVLDFKSEKR